jgi:hypothetical protein
MTRMVGAPQPPKEVVRGDGIRCRQERWTGWIVERPFHDLQSLCPWIEERIRETNAQTYGCDYAESVWKRVEIHWAAFAESDPTGRHDPAVLVLESGVGLDGMYHATGMDLFAELMVEHPGLLEEWLEALTAAELHRVAAMADPEHIPIALTYSDIAHKTGTMFSPDWLRRYWVPRLKRVNDAWHARETVCLFHSDGNLWAVLDDLTAAGIDGLNPIEVLAGMTVTEVREKYPRLFLAGGIDVSQLLTYGTPDEVQAACRQAIRDTAGLGYFLGSSTELHWDVPLENAIAMFETAWESGNR